MSGSHRYWPYFAARLYYSTPCKANRHQRDHSLTIESTAHVWCAVSLLTSTAISVARFLVLIMGLTYRTVVALRRVRPVKILVWLLSEALLRGVAIHYHGPWKCAGCTNWFDATSYCTVFSLLYQIICQSTHSSTTTTPSWSPGQPPKVGKIPLNIARHKKTVSSSFSAIGMRNNLQENTCKNASNVFF